MKKQTLLDAVREYGIHDIKTIIDAANGDISRMTLKNYWLNKPNLFKIICLSIKKN